MGMTTYEVNVDLLTTGVTLNLLIAAGDERRALSEAARTLDGIGILAREHYSPSEGLRIRPVNVTPTTHDFWQAA
jgi:hypothetical protein